MIQIDESDNSPQSHSRSRKSSRAKDPKGLKEKGEKPKKTLLSKASKSWLGRRLSRANSTSKKSSTAAGDQDYNNPPLHIPGDPPRGSCGAPKEADESFRTKHFVV